MEPLAPRLRLYEGAFAAIRDYVVRQRLRPGDPLPSEREMQQQLGISRAPVREALRVLQSVGLIEARQGKGLFVKELDLRPMVDAFVSHLELVDTDSFAHLLELRQILELGAAELAANRRTPDDLAAMAATLKTMRQRIDRMEPVLEQDLGFHDLLVKATHNPLIEQLYACLKPFLVDIREGGKVNEQVLDRCLTDHTAIFEAVEDQAAAKSVRIMQEHMECVRLQLAHDREAEDAPEIERSQTMA